MAKQRYQVKRKAGAIPKGLPLKKARLEGGTTYVNPFENSRASTSKSPKFLVHNRSISSHQLKQQNNTVKSALARALESRQEGLKEALYQENKAGSFMDRRIGEGRHGGSQNKGSMTQEERMLARVVRERVSRSKRSTRYNLEDDDNLLTHKGKTLMDSRNGQLSNMASDHVLLSSDDELGYDGQLDKVDTEMHFGGGTFDSKRRAQMNPYGPSDGADRNLGEVYRSRKQDLDDLIAMRKREKLLKSQRKEQQVEKFEELDAEFGELANLLQFRDKELERRQKVEARKNGNLVSSDEQEMDEWDKEMKEYLFERKVKATDRTKTPEELAKEKLEKLQKLEARRIARMNQDFENDSLADISDQDSSTDDKNHRRRQRKDHKGETPRAPKQSGNGSLPNRNPDELESDQESDRESDLDMRFSGYDGLVYTDKRGNIVKKTGRSSSPRERDSDCEEVEDEDDEEEEGEEENDDEVEDSEEYEEGNDGDDDQMEDEQIDDDSNQSHDKSESDLGEEYSESDVDSETGVNGNIDSLRIPLKIGIPVLAKHMIDYQFEKSAKWCKGLIRNVHHLPSSGKYLYDIDYDDGDFEERVRRKNIIPFQEHAVEEDLKKTQELTLSKRLKAADRARQEIPFTFEIPTTLDALHDLIGKYAQSGRDASIIVQRIHQCNSLHINKANKDKIQNFYDVLIRRFIALGDALYESGDGGDEVGRYDQLDVLTKTLYAISQEAPDIAGAMWSRRLGIMYNAMVKRLRDSEFVSSVDKEESDTFWPSTGTLLLLRALSHIFPCTDLRHVVVTPALLYVGQCLTHTPVTSRDDLVRGIYLACLMIEYTEEARRVAPEAMAFMAGTLQLFGNGLGESCANVSLLNLTHYSHSSSLRSLLRDADKSSSKFHSVNDIRTLQLSLEKDKVASEQFSLTILVSVLKLVEKTVFRLNGHLQNGEIETFQQISNSLTLLRSCILRQKTTSLLSSYIDNVSSSVSDMISERKYRPPLKRRIRATANQLAIQTLAPRLENPSSYSVSKDRGKDREQAEKDRVRREYKREHKAISRELRLDAAFIEVQRRKDKDAKDSKARNQRHKNFAWLVQEQASLNQQVAKGGGLLKGGGTGAARAKVATGKIGIKKGGKFR